MKNILITFVSYDQDCFKVKKGDVAFMYSHRRALIDHGCIREEALDQRTVPADQLGAFNQDIADILTKDDIWRPTVALAMGYEQILGAGGSMIQERLVFDEIYILHDRGNTKSHHDRLIKEILADVERRKPSGCVIHDVQKVFENPWGIGEVYKYLFNFFQSEEFHRDNCRYYVNITSGTNAIKNSLFLLTQERVIDAKRIMPHPWNDPRTRNYRFANGGYQIDDPANFDATYEEIRKEGLDETIKAINENIETQDPEFKTTLSEIARVAAITRNPILLTGPTGSGKTQIAKNIFSLLSKQRKIKGTFQHINCATLGGDPNISYSTLFGHVEGAYTDAKTDEDGALKLADGGILFLDEIGTLGMKEQAMLLTAIESRKFRPLGGKEDIASDFRLICGTNADLWEAVEEHAFRRDLLERINLWHFDLPGLCERRSEIMHQCQLFLDKIYPKKNNGIYVKFSNEAAKSRFQEFLEKDYDWPGNFRELNAILERMCELSIANRITPEVVEEEIKRTEKLRARGHASMRSIAASPSAASTVKNPDTVEPTPAAGRKTKTRMQMILGDETYEKLSPLDRVKLDYIADACESCQTLTDLGKRLYGTKKKDRSSISRELKKHGLSFRNGRLHKLD